VEKLKRNGKVGSEWLLYLTSGTRARHSHFTPSSDIFAGEEEKENHSNVTENRSSETFIFASLPNQAEQA
jgi:hypothetical protein